MPTVSTLIARRSLAGLAVVAFLAAGCGDDDDEGATTDTTDTTSETTATDPATGDQSPDDAASGDVLEVAAGEGDLNTFLSALEAAGAMDSLHGEGPFTVFAPTDDAFAAYLTESGMSQSEVFADPQALRPVLDFAAEGDDVMVGNAMVERYDLTASNGVIHVVDHVLIQPSMAGG